MTAPLKDYQEVAIAYLRGRDRAGLFLDMGLGKTRCVIEALEDHHLPVLVCAPKRVAEEVWDVEVEKWRPGLTVAMAVGEPEARLAALNSNADITVISRDNLSDVYKVNRRGRPWRTFVVDELSGFKTKGSHRWKNARRLVQRSTMNHVWGLTGTPSPNGLMDLWAQMYLLDGGARLGSTLGGFRGRYFRSFHQKGMPEHVYSYEIRPEAEAAIYRKIEDMCLAMQTEGRIKLPELTYNTLAYELPARARKAYRDIKSDMIVDLRDVLGEIHTAANAGVLTSKLSQITAGFIFEDQRWEPTDDNPEIFEQVNEGAYTPLHKENLNLVKEMVESLDSPVLLAYRFVPQKKMLLEAFGDRARDIDAKGVIRDWNKGNVPILLTHPASASHGLNLQYGGHTALWASPTWSLEEWDQFNKRLHRQGQENPVVIHSALANRSIDHYIRARVTDKAVTQGSLLSHLESPV